MVSYSVHSNSKHAIDGRAKQYHSLPCGLLTVKEKITVNYYGNLKQISMADQMEHLSHLNP